MDSLSKRQAILLLCVVAVLTLIPFLGIIDFHTKGEPREAIVAYSMLETDNWVLPANNGGDMAYKPPFFHWCIAVFSMIGGGVTEFTSRMPSALALIGMAIGLFLFYAKRTSILTALMTSFVMLTAFEVHRAGMACRVDMVLTALMVGALLMLYRWFEQNIKSMPWVAIVLMGAATLTKGPVGILLPCFVAGLFMWIKGFPFGKLVWKFVFVAICSMILPAIWYYLAYLQGGDQFVDLMLEENVDRFLGKMSYGSHERSFVYNFTTVIAGYLPWTILMAISLFALRYDKVKTVFRGTFGKLTKWVSSVDSVKLYSLLSIVVIFVFYCIPKSKRSVYLLPIYPFIAYFIVLYIQYLWREKKKVVEIFGYIIAFLLVLLTSVFVCIKMGWMPDPSTIFKGKHAVDTIIYIQALESVKMGFWQIFFMLLPMVVVVYFVMKRKNTHLFIPIIVMIFALYVSLEGLYQPTVLNKKSDKAWAMDVKKIVPAGKIYYYMSVEMLRFYVANFYLENRVVPFEMYAPVKGYLMITQTDFEKIFQPKYANYSFAEKSKVWSPELGNFIYLYEFQKK